GGADAHTESVEFEVYSLFETDTADGLAFVIDTDWKDSLLAARLGTIDVESLLKPIPPRLFQSRANLDDAGAQYSLELPYVCKQGNDLAYCKGIYLRDYENALRAHHSP